MLVGRRCVSRLCIRVWVSVGISFGEVYAPQSGESPHVCQCMDVCKPVHAGVAWNQGMYTHVSAVSQAGA